MIDDINFVGIRLSWARSTKDSRYLANFGDALSPIITSAIFNSPVMHSDFDNLESSFVAVGSIGHQVKKKGAVYWGTGIPENLSNNDFINEYEYLALRGPISQSRVSSLLGKPLAFGDPVILLTRLLPRFFKVNKDKSNDVLFVTHITDCEIDLNYTGSNNFLNSLADLGVNVLTTWVNPNFDSIHRKINQINSSKIIVSKSFHGHLLGVLFGSKTYLLNFSNVDSPIIKNVSLQDDETIDWRWRDFYLGQNCKTIPVLYVNPNSQMTEFDSIREQLENWDFEFPDFKQDDLLNSFIDKYKNTYNIDHLDDQSKIKHGFLNRITY